MIVLGVIGAFLGVVVFLALLVLMLGLDRDLRVRHLAAGGGRDLEQRQRSGQRGRAFLDRRLLIGTFGRVLEADDVHARHLERHGYLVALDGDVERAVAVNVRAELAMLLGESGASEKCRCDERGDCEFHETMPRISALGAGAAW